MRRGVLYKSKRYVPPLKVFFVPLWSENEFRLNPFWAGTGYELFCHFNPKLIRKRESYVNLK